MSDHAHHPADGAHGGHPPAEADRIQSSTIAGVVGATLLLFTVSAAVTVVWMYRQQRALNPDYPGIPAAAGQRKIGMVEQQLFENANRAQTLRRQQDARLHGYGWVDKEKGLVHLPIEQALELTLQGERP